MTDDASHHVTESDAFTLQLERDPALRATVVAVAVFDRAHDWDRLVDRIDRATRLAPSFREKLVSSPLRLAPPLTVTEEQIDDRPGDASAPGCGLGDRDARPTLGLEVPRDGRPSALHAAPYWSWSWAIFPRMVLRPRCAVS